MIFVTHVSIVTFDTSVFSSENTSLAYKTLRYLLKYKTSASVFLFSPDTFSVQNNSTSELLRFHDRMAASVIVVSHLFPLTECFGTLAARLGCFPFDKQP